jgi:hypothetical protein
MDLEDTDPAETLEGLEVVTIGRQNLTEVDVSGMQASYMHAYTYIYTCIRVPMY